MRPALNAAILAAILFFSTVLSPAHAFATTILFDPADATVQDILSISGGFDATTLFLSASFRPGTFAPGNLGFLFGLDTDLNALTGIQPPNFFPLGADFTVFGISSGGIPPTTANVTRFPGGVLQGTVPVAIGVDTFSLAIPLPLLGNDDGVANFGLSVGMPTSPTLFAATDLTIPGPVGTPGPLDGPTTPVATVPEPETFTLLSIGIAGLLGMCWWRTGGTFQRNSFPAGQKQS